MSNRVTPSTKLILITVLTAVPVSMLAARNFNSIWPGIPITIGATAIAVILLVDRGQVQPASLGLIGIVFLSAFHRLAIYLYPSSMIGMDPDGYAISAEQILQSGHTEYITSDFYAQAPLFPILSAISSILGRLPASDGMAVFPLLTGIVIGLFTYLIGREIVNPQLGLTGAVLAAVAADVTITSYLPIAQTLVILYFVPTIYLIQRYLEASRVNDAKRYLSTFLILMGAMVFTHRLPIFILILFVSVLFIATFVPNFLSLKSPRSPRLSVLILGALGFCLFIVQYVYVTGYITSLAFSIAYLFGDLSPASPPVSSAPDAERVYSGFFWALVRRIDSIMILTIGGSGWIITLYQWRDRPSATPYLVITGVLFALFPISILATESIRYTRVQRLITPFLIVFIASILLAPLDKWHPSYQTVVSAISVILLTLVLITQVTTPAAAPDNPHSYRFYLTNEEVTAKEFGHTYSKEEIFTEDYYALEEPYPSQAVRPNGRINTDRSTKYMSLQDRIFDSKFLDECTENVLYRDINIYRYSGIWRLTYDLKGGLETIYSKTYSNGDVSLYPKCKGQ